MNVTYRQVVALAVPVMLANISVPLVGIVDTAVMGRYASPDYINAVAIASVLFSSIFWAFGFLRMGTGGLIAQAFGKRDSTEVALATARGLSVAIVVGMLIVACGPVWFRAGMHFMTADTQLKDLVYAYYQIRLFAAPATLSLYVVFGTLIGLQRMHSLMALTLMLNLCNITLNVTLYQTTDWHVRGVAAATLVSEYLTLAFGLWLIRKQVTPVVTHWHELKSRFSNPIAFVRLWQISRDLFIRTSCLTLAFYWMTVLGSRQGAYVLAANTILLHLLNLMAHWLDGFAHAAESLAGAAYGRRDRVAFNRAIHICFQSALVLSLTISAVYLIFGEYLVKLFSPNESILEETMRYFWWVVVSPLIGVWSFTLDGIFTGITHTRAMRNGMLLALLSFFLCTLLVFPTMNNNGLWLSYSVLLLTRAATLGFALRRIQF